MDNRVRIEILGSIYTVFTSESEEYTKSLAREIDEQANRLVTANPKLSQNDALVLVALAYADYARKCEDNADNLRTQVSDYLDEATSTRIELDNTKRELASLKRRLEFNEKTEGLR